MSIIDKGEGLCTGCRVCYLKCPNKCIEFISNNQGFFYPKINYSKCSNCGICRRVCPINMHSDLPRKTIPDECYAAQHSDKGILKMSSSGGAFWGLVTCFANDTFFAGACFDEEHRVVHKLVQGTSNASIFRKSKYVQSDLGDIFNSIELALNLGKSVVFSGLSCQIAALKSFLSTPQDRLLCVEILCHGVASPRVFNKHISFLEKKYNQKLLDYTFRWKSDDLSGWRDFAVKLNFADGNETILTNDLFMRGYLEGLFHRECCLNCLYIDKQRFGDILLADFWGVENYNPDLFSKAGISMVLPITDSGFLLLEKLKSNMEIVKIPIKYAFDGNPVLYRHPNIGQHRTKFFNLFKQYNVDYSIKNCLESNSVINLSKQYLSRIIKRLFGQ